MTVPELNLTNVPAIVHYDVEVTDDPLVSRTALSKLPENTKVICLGSMGEWTYIESEENGVSISEGFVPTACLYATVTDMSEANRAIVGQLEALCRKLDQCEPHHFPGGWHHDRQNAA